MLEIELKFQVPESSRPAVDAALAAGHSRRAHLQAIYFDTADHRLAAAELSLRLRKEGRRWSQTLKARGSDAMQRFEHNVPLSAAMTSPVPKLDPRRHDGTSAGALLSSALAVRDGEPAPTLMPLYRTDIWRRRRVLRVPGGTVELALDIGEIVAGHRRWPVYELEIELLRGQARAVIDVACRWVQRYGLWLDIRSKAERGDRLARGINLGPVAKASIPSLDADMSIEAALRAVVVNCVAQILPNASEVASGVHSDEHVHQLRVGLRRLRSALRFFEGWSSHGDLPWGPALSQLFTQLGAARDVDMLNASLLPALRAAGAPQFDLPEAPETLAPSEVLRAAEANLILLELLRFIVINTTAPTAPPKVEVTLSPESAQAWVAAAPERRLSECVATRLQRWHRQVVRDAKRYTALDDAARHSLRKRIKRLRYALEFVASLYGGKSVKRYLSHLLPAQDQLGLYNDACVGLATYRTIVGDDPRAWFAVGWLTARRDALLAEGAITLKRYASAKPCWKGD